MDARQRVVSLLFLLLLTFVLAGLSVSGGDTFPSITLQRLQLAETPDGIVAQDLFGRFESGFVTLGTGCPQTLGCVAGSHPGLITCCEEFTKQEQKVAQAILPTALTRSVKVRVKTNAAEAHVS